jgi:transcriptional repressor NrdR
MKCPHCRSTKSEIYNSRSTKFRSQVWRRRRCLSCRKSFTTYEAPDLTFLQVCYNDSPKPMPYSRARLFTSIYLSFGAAQVTDETIFAITDTVESKLLDLQSPTLTKDQIGMVVLSTLKQFETSAFIRYLTSHTSVTNSSQLKREINKY